MPKTSAADLRALHRIDGDAIDRDDHLPTSVRTAMMRAGWFGLTIPRAFGGGGASRAALHDLVAAVAEKSAGTAMWITTHLALGAPAALAVAGTAEQRATYLPRLAAGELSALAVSEADAGSDLGALRTTARPTRGGWRLNGEKLYVTNAPVARWIVVLAKAPGGHAAFLVDAKSPGVSIGERINFLGLRGMENAPVNLRNVLVPAGGLIGAEGDGVRVALAALSSGRLTVASRALGLARAAQKAAERWCAIRRVRGFPLAKFPPAAAKLRRLTYLTEAIDATGLFTAEWADQGKNLRRESMLAKVFAARAACEAADLALQLRGARGYETADSQRRRGENPDACERFLRDARGLRLIEGGEDVLLDALAGSGDDAPARAIRAADRFAAECVAAQRARSSAARARR